MSETTIYDQRGAATAYFADDGETIYLWTGQAMAYLSGENVYRWNGKHIGWYVNGIFHDLRGARVGFISGRSPVAVMASPAKYAKYEQMAKYARHAPYARAALSLGMSTTPLASWLQQ